MWYTEEKRSGEGCLPTIVAYLLASFSLSLLFSSMALASALILRAKAFSFGDHILTVSAIIPKLPLLRMAWAMKWHDRFTFIVSTYYNPIILGTRTFEEKIYFLQFLSPAGGTKRFHLIFGMIT